MAATITENREAKPILAKPKKNKRHTVAEKQLVVEETLIPGNSVSIVARKYDLNANQVFNWRRQYKLGELGKKPGATLVPVGIIGKGGAVKAKAGHLPIYPCEPVAVSEVSKRTNVIEVEFRSGTRIRIDADIKPMVLQQVLKFIRSLA